MLLLIFVSEMSQKATVSRINDSQWCELAAPILKETFGDRVYLAKRKGRWAVLKIATICDGKPISTGRTAREALENAGLEDWIKRTELNENAKR